MNKVWMITGSNRGLGRAFAEEAVKNGDLVIAGTRRIDENDPFYADSHVLPVRLDVTDNEQIKAAVQAGIEEFSRIDYLINNAGYGMNGAFEETSEKELRDLFDADYFGMTNMIKAVLPVMRDQHSGRILNISSQAGMAGAAGCSAYNAAKFAVVGMSEALNEELAPFGIQVAAVCPGSFRTDFRDASSMRHPESAMSEYNGTAAHNVVKFLRDNNHKQTGDPKKAAAFVYRTAQKENMPVHITVGKSCSDIVKNNLRKSIDEIDSYYTETSDMEYDPE